MTQPGCRELVRLPNRLLEFEQSRCGIAGCYLLFVATPQRDFRNRVAHKMRMVLHRHPGRHTVGAAIAPIKKF